MTFQQLVAVQKEYPNKDKQLTIAFADELLGRKDLMGIDSLRGIANMFIGENYRNYGENDKAKTALTESVSIFSRLKMTVYRAQALVSLGNYYSNVDNDSTAMRLYTQSLEIAEQHNDTTGILRPYRSITGLYLKMGLYEKALVYGNTGLQLARKFNNEVAIATISNNIAGSYYKREMHDSAIYFFKQALVINRKYPDKETIIRNLSNIGTAYTYENKLDSAERYMSEAEALLPMIEVPRTFIYTYSAIAALHNKQEKYGLAIKYSRGAIDAAAKAGLEGLSDGGWEQLWLSYKGLKMYDSSLLALEKYWDIKKKFLETGRNKTVAQVEQQFQQYKKDNEITLLKKDKTLGKTQRNAALVVASLLAVAALLFYNRLRLKKRSSDALAQKNNEIEKQKELIETSLSEKETLLREIHHRVKNNLQIISSLLNLQSGYITDEAVLSSIHEGQSRVQAMSLIHQNLYQSDHLSNVDIENYLQQLVSYLSGMFTGDNRSIQVQVAANHINFDIDTAIPLGLIVNELVSNAYKYAFEKHGKGNISIAIQPITDIEYELKVSDDGVGLPSDFNAEKSNSLGLKLVKILSRQLRGSLTTYSDKGSSFVVRFKDMRAYQAANA